MKKSLKVLFSLIFIFILSHQGWAQTTVFSDNFNRASLSPGGSPSMTYSSTLATGTTAAISSSTYLSIVNSTTNGVSYVTGPVSTFSSPYNSILTNNNGIITWTFNFRWNRSSSNNPAAPASGSYGQSIILASSSSNFTSGSTGYAVVYGNSSTPDPIRLVRFNNGVTGTLTNICSSGASDISSTNNYASVRVTYDPTSDTWALFVRDDGASAWADPSTGVTSQKGSNTVDNTYAGSSLTHFGFLWSHAGTANLSGDFDNFKVTITESASSLSDIIENTSFTYPTNIDYTSYQGTSLTTDNSIEVAQFYLRDGGSLPDADALSTILTAISFNVTNSGSLRRIALFDGSTNVAEVAAGSTASFSGLSLTAADGGSKTFSIRVSFLLNNVTDNQQFSFTVSSATASGSGSGFAAANAGGAASSTNGDNNRIEVTASDIIFDQNVSNVSLNTVMSPSPTLRAVDANVNYDLDYGSGWSISVTTGSVTFSGTSTGSFSGGSATLSDVKFSTSGTGNKITVTSGGYSDESSLFNVTNAQPEINVKQDVTSIPSGNTYSLGSVTSGTSSSVITFTIENLGAATLNLNGTPIISKSGTNASEFSVDYTSTSSTVAASGTTTFTLTFSPTSQGSKTASISIANDDADENPYTINLTGTGTVSSASDITNTGGYEYISNIAYATYQTVSTLTTGNTIGVNGLTIRDGGGSADGDNLGTTLTAISFSTGSSTAIRTAALFDGSTNVSEVAVNGGTTISFTGLSLSASDGGTKNFELRVTFQSTVTDNQQISFTVSSVTASSSGSNFAAADGGGAASSTTGDINRIEVTATQLAFVQGPTNTVSNSNMTPAVTVKTIDGNSNTDLDYVTNVNITSSGTLSSSPQVSTPSSGVATFSSINHTESGTGLTLTASSGSLTGATSGTFNITIQAAGLLLAEEDFNFSGNLTSNGWTAHSGGGTNPLATTTGLTYANYPGSGIGNSVLVGNSGGEDDNIGFTGQSTNGSIVYFSMLVDVTESSDKTGDYFFNSGTRASGISFTSYASRLFVKTSGSNVNFGLSNSTSATYGSTNYSKNTTYLLIIKYTINTGGNDEVKLWVLNSSIPSSESQAGNAEVTNTTTAGTDVIDAIAIRQGGTNQPSVKVDGIRVATNWGTLMGNPQFDGTSDIAAGTYNSITLHSGSNVTMAGNVSVTNSLTVSGGTLTVGAHTLTIPGSITRTGGSINASNSSGTLEFTNTSPLTLPNSLFSGNVGNLKMNGSGGVTLGSNTTIDGTLTLTSGILNTTDSYTLTLGENATNPTETETAYINGKVTIIKNVGTGSFHFIGCNMTAGDNIGILTLTRTSGPSGASNINNYNSIADNWNMTTTVSGSRSVALYWHSPQDNGNDFSTEKSAQLYNYVSGSWSKNGNGKVITGNTRQYSETISLSSTSTKYSVAVPSTITLYSQNFDTDNWIGTNTSQPDANWTNTPTTGNTSWRLNNQTASNNTASWSYPIAGKIKSYGNSGYSAQFHTYGSANASPGTFDLKLDFSTVGTKKLSFYYTNATGSDNLKIQFSTNNGVTFDAIPVETFTTGSWDKKTVTLGTSTEQNCIIRFLATSDFGRDDIGIDNVEVYVDRYSYTTDPGMYSINMNENYNTGSITPQATVKNYGSTTLSSFDVTMTIGVYSSTKTVTNLAANGTSLVSFDSWSPTAGTYTVSVSTSLSGDQNAANNTLTKSVGVSSGTWSDGNIIPAASYLGSAVGYTDGVNKYLYVTGGVGTETKFYKYTEATNTWSTLPDLPVGKTVHASAIVNGYLYVIGGANNGSYLSTVYRFNLSNESGNWETMQPLTKSIGWGKAAVHGNYIYLVGGYTRDGGAQALGTVYVYNTINNTWSVGTPLNESRKRFGGALSIVSDKLVYIAGASSGSTLTNEVLIGQITDPTTISWSVSSSPFPGNGNEIVIPSNIDLASLEFPKKNIKSGAEGDEPMSVYPAGSLYCLDAAPWGDNSIIVAGGTDGVDGNPVVPSLCYAFDLSNWAPKQSVPTPVYGSGLGTVYDGTNWYLLLASGYTTNGTTDKTQKFLVPLSGNPPRPSTVNLISGLEGGSATDNPPQTSVTVEIRNSTAPYSIVDAKTFIQNESGFGTAEFNIPDVSKSYYIVVRYANGLETWSAQPQFFINGVLNYDFTTSQSQAYGNNLVKVGGKWFIICGDIDQDGKINAMDRGICWNDRGTADVYSDLNGDGVVNELDRAILVKNKNLTVKKPEGAVTSTLKIGKKSFKSSNE